MGSFWFSEFGLRPKCVLAVEIHLGVVNEGKIGVLRDILEKWLVND